MRARSNLDRTLHHVNNAEAALLQGTNVFEKKERKKKKTCAHAVI